jgi:outer membrane murein-binding lipoprotein Lpp
MNHTQKTLTTGTTPALAAAIGGILAVAAAPIFADNVDALEQRIMQLNAELEAARAELAATKRDNETLNANLDEKPQPTTETAPDKINIGPLTIGGAIRANYILGDYPNGGNGPNRGGNGGNVELDVFRINVDLDYNDILGKLEYRWYNGYNFIHTGWLGYQLDDKSQIQAGVTRVPFGPGPYGVSQSWFFDQHYYVGLSDDMDLGIKFVTEVGDWDLDFAYFASSEWDGNGTSKDSARYGYDAVLWRESIAEDGTVSYGGPVNGLEERNQFNVRAIYGFKDIAVPTDVGFSAQYGGLKGRNTEDGDHWAASLHMVNQMGNFKLASQITRYEYNISSDNPWNTDTLIPMGAYDFAWPVATKAWVPAISASYKIDTGRIPWLDYVLPYLEYSSIIKDESSFNDSELWVLGAAWARGGWYIYTDLAYSNGNYFVGNKGDNYGNIIDPGVGDFGVDGNDEWNYRFNINLGYYF